MTGVHQVDFMNNSHNQVQVSSCSSFYCFTLFTESYYYKQSLPNAEIKKNTNKLAREKQYLIVYSDQSSQ